MGFEGTQKKKGEVEAEAERKTVSGENKNFFRESIERMEKQRLSFDKEEKDWLCTTETHHCIILKELLRAKTGSQTRIKSSNPLFLTCSFLSYNLL